MKKALLVGNIKFIDPKILPLAAPRSDIEELKGVLEDKNIGAFDSVICKFNIGLEDFQIAVSDLFRDAKRDDLIVFYYAGHGLRDIRGRLHLALPKTRSDAIWATALKTRFILEQMQASHSEKLVIILDCCHAGAVAKDGDLFISRDAVDDGILDDNFIPKGKGTYVLAACQPGEKAYEQKGGSSVFTRTFIDGIKTGEAAREKEILTINDIHSYIDEQRLNNKVLGIANPFTEPLMISSQSRPLEFCKNPNVLVPIDSELLADLRAEKYRTRIGAVTELGKLMNSADLRLAENARKCLENHLTTEVHFRVRDAIAALLRPIVTMQSNKVNLSDIHAPEQVPINPGSLDDLLLKFLNTWPTWGFTPSRVKNFGSKQIGFKKFGNYNTREIGQGLKKLEASGLVRGKLSKKGNYLFQIGTAKTALIEEHKPENKLASSSTHQRHKRVVLAGITIVIFIVVIWFSIRNQENPKLDPGRDISSPNQQIFDSTLQRNDLSGLLSAIDGTSAEAVNLLRKIDVSLTEKDIDKQSREDLKIVLKDLVSLQGAKQQTSSKLKRYANEPTQNNWVDARAAIERTTIHLNNLLEALNAFEGDFIIEDFQTYRNLRDLLNTRNGLIEMIPAEAPELAEQKSKLIAIAGNLEKLDKLAIDVQDSLAAYLTKEQEDEIENVFNLAKISGRITDLGKFMQSFPNNKFAKEAENLAWNSALNIQNTEAAYEAYVEYFPNGKNVDLANQKLSLLKTAIFKDCEQCPEMKLIVGGQLKMGAINLYDSHYDKNSLPVQEVLIESFHVGIHEITWGQWEQCVLAKKCKNISNELIREHSFRPGDLLDVNKRRNLPVTIVNWDDAQAYTEWLSTETGYSYRLLSESEWEYVARAGTKSIWYFGNSNANICKYENTADKSLELIWGELDVNFVSCNDGYSEGAPVGQFPSNQFGVHDIIGNVSEWLADCWSVDLKNIPKDGNPYSVEGCKKHVIRGGSWGDDILYNRVSSRHDPAMYKETDKDVLHNSIGFRVARDN